MENYEVVIRADGGAIFDDQGQIIGRADRADLLQAMIAHLAANGATIIDVKSRQVIAGAVDQLDDATA